MTTLKIVSNNGVTALGRVDDAGRYFVVDAKFDPNTLVDAKDIGGAKLKIFPYPAPPPASASAVGRFIVFRTADDKFLGKRATLELAEQFAKQLEALLPPGPFAVVEKNDPTQRRIEPLVPLSQAYISSVL